MTSTVEVGALDIGTLRKQFPLLEQESHGRRLVYLDSAASSQHPRAVLDAMDRYYETTHANVHRGVYAIAEEATRQFEAARHAVGRFIGAPRPGHRGLVREERHRGLQPRRPLLWAPSPPRRKGGPPHRARAPCQLGALVHARRRARDRAALHTGRATTTGSTCPGSTSSSTVSGLVGVSCMSNVLGTINDLRPIVAAAHSVGAIVVADGSQLVPHRRIDVGALGVDLLAFTGHKMLGPTGIGVLWGREELLEAMPPFLGGGEMIRDVRLDGFTPNELPWKFEAGTPPIAEAVGLHAAIDFLEAVGMDRIAAHEVELTSRAISICSKGATVRT